MRMSCDNCIHEAEIQDLKKDAERNSNTHREFYNKLGSIDVKQGIFDNTLATMQSTLNGINAKLDKLVSEPGDNYKTIKMCIITGIITGVVGIVIGALFKMVG